MACHTCSKVVPRAEIAEHLLGCPKYFECAGASLGCKFIGNNASEIIEHNNKCAIIPLMHVIASQQSLLKWLSASTDPSINHNRAMEKREPETGNWFLESDEYFDWLSEPGFVWLRGIRT